MNNSKLKWALIVLFSLYSICIFIWGDTGLISMNKQIFIKYQLESNIGNLLKINNDLNRHLNAYKSDSETITIQARNLGYIDKNEKILFIDNLSTSNSIKKPGEIILPEKAFSSVEKNLRLIVCAIACFLLILASWNRMRRKE